MDALVIEGKKKSDYDILILLAKKLGLKVHLVNDKIFDTPNTETIKAIIDARAGKGTEAKDVSDLMQKLTA